jgi:hypothetical protein
MPVRQQILGESVTHMSQADHADLSCPSIGSAQSNLHLGLPDICVPADG